MKIGITCYPTYGGSGAVATELGIALADRGHEVHFITYQLPFRLPVFLPRVYFHEVDVGHYPLFQYPPYDLARISANRRQLWPVSYVGRPGGGPSVDEVLADPEIHLVAAAAVTSERGPLGCQVMEAGKDYFTDKAPFTTLEQLAQTIKEQTCGK